MYDENAVVKQIKELPKDVKAHLSHVGRNGVLKILSAYRRNIEAGEAAVREHEKEWEVLGL